MLSRVHACLRLLVDVLLFDSHIVREAGFMLRTPWTSSWNVVLSATPVNLGQQYVSILWEAMIH